MKKKTVKKLKLAKETVRKRELTVLEKAAGGSVGGDCQSDPVYNTCGGICQQEPLSRQVC